jgi:hypothetical protein
MATLDVYENETLQIEWKRALRTIDMLAERGRIWAVLAHANAVLGVTHEVGPLVDLL